MKIEEDRQHLRDETGSGKPALSVSQEARSRSVFLTECSEQKVEPTGRSIDNELTTVQVLLRGREIVLAFGHDGRVYRADVPTNIRYDTNTELYSYPKYSLEIQIPLCGGPYEPGSLEWWVQGWIWSELLQGPVPWRNSFESKSSGPVLEQQETTTLEKRDSEQPQPTLSFSPTNLVVPVSSPSTETAKTSEAGLSHDTQVRPISVTDLSKKWAGGVWLNYQEIPTAYIDIKTGQGVFGDLVLKAGRKKPSLLEIIAVLPSEVRRVALVGSRPGTAESLYRWYRQREVGEEWEVVKFVRDDDLPILDLRTRGGEGKKRRTLRVQRAAQWFDDDLPYSPAQARDAMKLLEEILQRVFDRRARCLVTPGATGLALWDSNRHATYPQLSEEHQRLIRGTSGQGRFELSVQPGRTMLSGFAYEDMRLAYGAFSTGLGFGPVEHLLAGQFDPDAIDLRRRGRYKVRFTIPRDWSHAGIFAVKADDGETWWYPRDPGYEGETWVDGVELQLALRPPLGMPPWKVKVEECLLLQSAHKGAPWPLDTWASKLIDVWKEIGQSRLRGEVSPLLAELVLQGLRAILLHAIGGFHRSESSETIILYSTAELKRVPAQYRVEAHGDGSWTYERPAPLNDWSRQKQHPEWSSAVYARCRVHELFKQIKRGRGQVVAQMGALTLPYCNYVGSRVDALYLDHDPGWTDTGEPGQFRLKGLITEPVPAPSSFEELNALRDRSVENLRRQRDQK